MFGFKCQVKGTSVVTFRLKERSNMAPLMKLRTCLRMYVRTYVRTYIRKQVRNFMSGAILERSFKRNVTTEVPLT